MRKLSSRSASLLLVASVLLALSNEANAQDPIEVDSTHYSVVLENDDVRVIRISYGPGETSVMHEHPKSVVVALSDGSVSFALPDGTTQAISWSAGEVMSIPAGAHQPTNTGEAPMEVIQIELKSNSDEHTMHDE